MDKITNAFQQFLNFLLESTKKHGMLTVLSVTFFLCFISTCTFVIARNDEKVVDIVEQTLQKNQEIAKQEHDNGMYLRHSVNEKMENYLISILAKTGADRVLVLEMHNGVNNTNGLPFVYVDATYSKYSDGVIPVDNDYVNLNMSRFYFFSYAIKKQTWGGYVKDVKVFDNKFSGRMISNGVNYIYVSTLHSDKSPFGFIILGFGDEEHNDGLNKVQLDQIMGSYTQKISNLLNPNAND